MRYLPPMVTLSKLEDLDANPFDDVIDVRSPSEFAEDHLPGAINLPVLSDAERARVGTIYKQESQFLARKIGAALVFANAARHLETALADRPGAWRPLVYCWRGGQRSGSFSWMLREIGWRAETVAGGYRSYRRLVVGALYDAPLPHRLVLLGGYTGTAKTDLLARLPARGVQVLDLEGLARHRGSLLGAGPDPQPSQKSFESALAAGLRACDPARPVVVEAESSRIGRVTLPPAFWAAMGAAPTVAVDAPLDARARYLARAYADIFADSAALKAKLAPLRRFRGRATVDAWGRLIDAGEPVAICQALAEDHYDPAYDRAMAAQGRTPQARVSAAELTDAALEKVADAVAVAVENVAQAAP
ncbi:MAG: tRNA 2-selenouridine(34) synthase MnmH [Pseudomonadota bacterium]